MAKAASPRATSGLRAKARDAIRDEVITHAWLLFAAHGYAATTIDQVAEAAGMSRRTFFRYFTGKDELVTTHLAAQGDQIAAALEQRPSSEPAWDALRMAFDELIEQVETHEDIARPLHAMLQREPEVRAALHEGQHRWHELLEPEVTRRVGGDGPPSRKSLHARALLGAAIACLDAALATWAAASPGTSLRPLVDDAMRAVAPLHGR